MKPILYLPLILALLVAGSTLAHGQEINSRKVERIKRKIEKQQRKLNEMTGKESKTFYYSIPPVDEARILEIRSEALTAKDRALQEHQQAMKEFRKQMELKQKELSHKQIEIRREFDKNRHYYSYSIPDLDIRIPDPIVFSVPDIRVDLPPRLRGGVYNLFGDQDILDVRKELTGESSSVDFPYEIKEGATGLSLSVNGSIESGKVLITIKKPDGSIFNEYTLSPLADVNWRQSISFDEQEADSYEGKWMVTVTAEQAAGSYSLQIRGR
ncbi:MAG: hypothetical protein R6V75_12210 [Bacteroidales bacterium]